MPFPITVPLARLLAEMSAHVPPERIEQAWIFPPRHHRELETGLVVLALRGEDAAAGDVREVVTVRYEQRAGEAGSRVAAGHGWAPAERLPRLIDGVVRRLGVEGEDPVVVVTGGDVSEWAGQVAAMIRGILDPANGE